MADLYLTLIMKWKVHLFLSGTQVNSGDGAALALAVGPNSENGKIRQTINENKSSDEGTPLQQKLTDLADKIGWLGLICAVLTSIGMGLKTVSKIFSLEI